jgi:hypothetical protein
MSIYDPIAHAMNVRQIPLDITDEIPEESWFSWGGGRTGLPHSEETKHAISESLKGVKNTLGLKRSDENKRKVAEARRNAPRKPCPYCNKMFQSAGLAIHLKHRKNGKNCK